MTIRTVTYNKLTHGIFPLEPDETMMHAAEDVPAPRPYGAVYRAMTASAPPFTSLPNPDLAVIDLALEIAANSTGQNRKERVAIQDAIAALKRIKGDV